MKSLFHSLIPFLPLFCSCQFQRLDSIQFLCSQAHILARLASRNSTLHFRLDYSSIFLILYSCYFRLLTVSFYIHLVRPTQKTQPLLLRRRVCPLPSNGRTSVACLRFAGMCLPSRCLETSIHLGILFVVMDLKRCV
jgi:hypothetical protein